MEGNMYLTALKLGATEHERLYLKVRVYLSDSEDLYYALMITPDSQTIITSQGATVEKMMELFIDSLSCIMGEKGDLAKEVMGMFMPAFYFEPEELLHAGNFITFKNIVSVSDEG